MISFTSRSASEIKQKIDTFLAEEKPFRPLHLVMPAGGGAVKWLYKDIPVREWQHDGNVRFDAAVELAENEK